MEELAVRNNIANKSEIKQYIVIRINNEFFGITPQMYTISGKCIYKYE